MFLVLSTSCDNEHLDDRPQYAVVRVTIQSVRRWLSLLDKAAAFAADERDTYSIELWDGGEADWRASIGWMDDDDTPPADLLTEGGTAEVAVSDGGYALVAESPAEAGSERDARTECDTMQLRVEPGDRRDGDGIVWRAMPKHTDSYLTTSEVTRNDLREILAKLGGEPAPEPRKELWVAIHSHRHGITGHVFRYTAGQVPTVAEIVEGLKIDYEPEREEFIDLEKAGNIADLSPAPATA